MRAATIIVLAVLVTVGGGAGLFVHFYSSMLGRSFVDRSVTYTTLVASSASAWIDQPDRAMLQTIAWMLLVGSVRYVQIVSGGELLVDERVESFESIALPIERAPSLVRAATRPSPGGGSAVDVLAPIPGSPEAYARIGIDRARLIADIRGTAALASGIATAIAAALIGALQWISRRRRAPGAADPWPREPRRMTAGALTVDLDATRVTIGETEVGLTPKQFELLALLVGARGRVLSDREILSAVWPDAPYADSKDVKQYIYLLRRRLGRDWIETVPGFGYRLAEPCDDRELTDR